MRDKVIQNSIAKELSNIYGNFFSESCYAYRNGRSALQAAQTIHEKILEKKKGYVLRTDISSFFDRISHSVLQKKLRERIYEKDVLDLIFEILRAPSIDKNGVLEEKKVGIYQGSTIAPVLSNIYMMKFDEKVRREVQFYVRYSDDIIILFQTKNEAEEYYKKLNLYLEELNLELNMKKTKIVSLEEGFDFLGYRFNSKGMAVPDKAEKQLSERLEEVWLNTAYRTVWARLEKGAEIVGGWEQYYYGKRVPGSILEYAVWIYQMKKRSEMDLPKAKELRESFENPYKDVAGFLADVWKENSLFYRALWEYEQYYNLSDRDKEVRIDESSPFLPELINIYERFMIEESSELRTELIQIYSDLKMYRKAEALTEMGQRKPVMSNKPKYVRIEENAEIFLNQQELSEYMELFVGREDLYAIDGLGSDKKRMSEEVLQPLLPDVVKNHIAGKETVSTYIQRNNGTAKYLVLDLDISKGVLLQNRSQDVIQEYMSQCLHIADGILKEMRHMGLNGYLEQSGCRGYHIWVFFTEWLPVRYVNQLSDIVEQKAGKLWKETGIQVEYFPNKTRIRNGKKGQTLKLPWGFHPKTGKRSVFLDSDYQPYQEQKDILKEIVRHFPNDVKRIIAANMDSEKCEGQIESREVDKNLEEFQITSEAVRTVMESCNLLRYLCQKARTVHYLNHFERLTILYVFGHLGDEGKEFIHKVMSFTLNYSYQVTQKFILKCPEKPVSCLKLREQYKQISAEIGCTCSFKRTKNCYPSPVLHALKKVEENGQITMPVSKTMPANTQKELKDEINVALKAQEIAEKMMGLRKQRRGLDKALNKCEQELMAIFDDCGTDSMEIKMGLLVRRKNNDRTEWMIEL
ncbi:MAG: CRISPR-associated primase-polymerase type A1 [Eubacteriales bacterium]|nr:CRISPR-associated primase-polymerase type A1 [Eubacteriales bacterium]